MIQQEQKDWIKKNWESLCVRGKLSMALKRYWQNTKKARKPDVVDQANAVFAS